MTVTFIGAVTILLCNTLHAQTYQLITSGLDAVSFESGLTELEAGDVKVMVRLIL